MEITKGENANLAGMEPRCPKCDGAITWEKDDKFAVCNRAHKTDKGIIFHQFEIKSLADLAQFFRSPAPTPPLDVEAAHKERIARAKVLAQKLVDDQRKNQQRGKHRNEAITRALWEFAESEIGRHIASPAQPEKRDE